MMIERIKKAIAAESAVSDWRLVEARMVREERYFVGRGLDLARRVDSVDYRLTVYVDGEGDKGRVRGEASVSIHPTMDDADLSRVLSRAVFAAASSRNPWFPLPEAAAYLPLASSGFSAREAGAWMDELAQALYAPEGRQPAMGAAGGPSPGARINSLELFLSRRELRVLNSRGVDAAYVAHRGYVESTVDARGDEGIVELTEALSFGEPDPARLSDWSGRRLALAADRAAARPLPSGLDLPLVLSGDEAREILGYWFANLNLARIHSKASPFEIGKSVHGEEGALDPLSLTAESRLAGSPDSAPVDAEGLPLGRLVLVENGLVKAFHGPSRFAAWLGLPAPGDYPLFSVAPGGLSEAGLRAGPHLEVAAFSDFNVDPDSGDFGAEIRLAWLSDGSSRRPVRGGSVTGSLQDNRQGLRLSKDLGLSGSLYGPKSILLPKVSITGAE